MGRVYRYLSGKIASEIVEEFDLRSKLKKMIERSWSDDNP